MKKLIKNLFLPLAVFAMLGLGALTLSASNVTNDVVTENMEVAENLAQIPYNGVVYYMDPNTDEFEPTDIDGRHCSLIPGNIYCYGEVEGVGEVQLFGESAPGVFDPLYEIEIISN